jgi:hypothetical protein
MRHLIIGIDPGASGGIAAAGGKAIYTHKLDDLHGVCEWIKELCESYSEMTPLAYIEAVPKFVGRNIPSSSSFTLGKSYGELLGVLAALKIKTHRIRPQEWQKTVRAGIRGKKSYPEWKRHLKNLASELWPTTKVTLWNADALLLLEFGLLKHYAV